MKKITLLLLLNSLFFVSCKKEGEDSPIQINTYETVEDQSKSDAEYDDADRIVQVAFRNEVDNNNTRLSNTYCYTANLDVDAKRMVLTFDPTCTAIDTKKRSGKIIVDYTAPYREEGAIITTTFENYEVNGVGVKGTKTVKNLGENAAGKTYYSVEIKDGELLYTNNTTLKWESSRYRVWVEGEDTPINILDDVYHVYGNASGVDRTGRSYTVEVPEATPLVINLNCIITNFIRLPVSGILIVKPQNVLDRTIDYGDGTCNSSVTVSVAGVSKEISLPF